MCFHAAEELTWVCVWAAANDWLTCLGRRFERLGMRGAVTALRPRSFRLISFARPIDCCRHAYDNGSEKEM